MRVSQNRCDTPRTVTTWCRASPLSTYARGHDPRLHHSRRAARAASPSMRRSLRRRSSSCARSTTTSAKRLGAYFSSLVASPQRPETRKSRPGRAPALYVEHTARRFGKLPESPRLSPGFEGASVSGACDHLSPAPRWSASITWSRLKLPTLWLGGNSLKVARNFPTYCCAGTSRKMCSNLQRS